MSWSKVKNIIILLLVVTNISLLLFVAFPRAQTEFITDEELSSAISILKNNGISVDAHIIPQSIAHMPLTLTPDRSDETTFATALLGKQVEQQDLGGNIHLYFSENGSIRFHTGGEFSAQFQPTIYPIGDGTVESHSAALLSQLSLSTQLTLVSPVENGCTVTYSQLWDDIVLLGCGAKMTYVDDSLRSISDARRLTGTASSVSHSVLPISTALMKFLTGLHELGDVCRNITAITPAYSVSTELSGVSTLTPVWCIYTDTSGYYLNLVSGALSRITT